MRRAVRPVPSTVRRYPSRKGGLLPSGPLCQGSKDPDLWPSIEETSQVGQIGGGVRNGSIPTGRVRRRPRGSDGLFVGYASWRASPSARGSSTRESNPSSKRRRYLVGA